MTLVEPPYKPGQLVCGSFHAREIDFPIVSATVILLPCYSSWSLHLGHLDSKKKPHPLGRARC